MDSQSKMPKEDLNNNELNSQNRLLLSSSSLLSETILQGDNVNGNGNDNKADKGKEEGNGNMNGNDKQRESRSNSLKKKRRNEQGRNGRWQRGEHELFIQGCLAHGNNWKKVKEIVKSRTSAQIRSHAQKYLIKLAKKHHDYIEANKMNRKGFKIRGRIDADNIQNDLSSFTEFNGLDNNKDEIERRILSKFQNESNSMNYKMNIIKEKNNNNSNSKLQGNSIVNNNTSDNCGYKASTSSSSLSSIRNQTIINNSNKNNYYLLFSAAEKQKNFDHLSSIGSSGSIEQNAGTSPLMNINTRTNTNGLNQSFTFNNNTNTSIMPNYPITASSSPYAMHYNHHTNHNNLFNNDYHPQMNYLYSNVTANVNNNNTNTNSNMNYHNDIIATNKLFHCLNLMANPISNPTHITSNSQAMKDHSNYHNYYSQLLHNLYQNSQSAPYYDFTLNTNK